MNSIADLQKFEAILSKRGYTAQDIENIFSQNWLRFIRKAWS
nr:dipeptidase [Mucilaginibacter humi]